MTLREYAMRRFALSEDGYRYLCRSSLACILKDLALMFPVMVLFMFVCDVMGGPGNPYDLDLGAWAYIAMIVVSAALIAVIVVSGGYLMLTTLFGLTVFSEAILEVPGNIVQSAVGAVLGLVLYSGVRKAYRQLDDLRW